MLQKQKLTEADKKTRKNWLASLVVLNLGLPLLTIGILTIFSTELDLIKRGLTFSSADLIQGSLALVVGYHCVYRKMGTVWLRLNLIVGPLVIIDKIFETINTYKANPSQDWIIYELILITAMYVWFYILSLKALKINKKSLSNANCSSPIYLEAQEKFQSASSIEELNLLFGNLIREKGYGNLTNENLIITAYKNTKKSLF